MNPVIQASLEAEERLVAELAQLGVGYLSYKVGKNSPAMQEPYKLLSQLVCQPSSRVRAALIALLLARPDYSEQVYLALNEMTREDAQRFRFLYSAAVYLQQRYARKLKVYLGESWRRLPDLFSHELGITGATPKARLKNLAHLQAIYSGEYLNWEGTFDNVARLLIHRWECEQRWKI